MVDSSAFSAFDDALADAAGRERGVLTQCMTECFASKATSTIGKRLGSLNRLATFCESRSRVAFPLSEKGLYAYMSELRNDVKSSASAGRSFLEAVRFSAAILGLHGLDKDKIPPRVSGVAEMLAKRAPVIKQFLFPCCRSPNSKSSAAPLNPCIAGQSSGWNPPGDALQLCPFF